MQRIRRIVLALASVFILCASGFVFAAPAGAGDGSVLGCFRVSIDVRAPYPDGSCPSGYTEIPIVVAPSPTSAEPVCIKVKTDWRSPYKDGTCPDGYDLVLLQQDPYSGQIPVCTKPKTDVRGVYPEGKFCPDGYDLVWLIAGSGPPPI